MSYYCNRAAPSWFLLMNTFNFCVSEKQHLVCEIKRAASKNWLDTVGHIMLLCKLYKLSQFN